MGLLKGLAELAIVPFDIAADVVTMGGVMVDKGETFTARRLRRTWDKFDE